MRDDSPRKRHDLRNDMKSIKRQEYQENKGNGLRIQNKRRNGEPQRIRHEKVKGSFLKANIVNPKATLKLHMMLKICKSWPYISNNKQNYSLANK